MYFRITICAFYFLFGIVTYPYAQPGFERVYGGLNLETANFIKPTADHGYVLVGSAMDPVYQTSAYYVLKIDSNGNELWSRIIGDPMNAFGLAIVPTYDGGYAFVGSHTGIFYDVIAEIVKLDSLGNLVNSNTFPPADGWGTAGIGILQTRDSNLAISVYTDGFISQNYYSLYKIAPDLSTSWTNFLSYDGSFVNVHDVVQGEDGNYFSLGYYDNFYFVYPMIPQATAIRKFAADGSLLIDSVFEFHSVSNSIYPTSDSGIIISGYQDSLSSRWMKLTRLNQNGTPLWQKMYACPDGQDAYVAKQVADGGFVILSTVAGVLSNQHDLHLMKVNGSGDSLWSKNYGSYYDEHALHFEETSDHGFVILGSTNSFSGSKIYVIKTDSLGNLPMEYQIAGTGNYFCEGDTLHLSIQPVPPITASILWSNGEQSDSIALTATGNYTATIVEPGGDTIRTGNYPAYFALRPVANISSQDTLQLCHEILIGNLNSGDISCQYQWYLNDTLLPGETTPDILPAVAGRYSLVIWNYCGSDTARIMVDSIFALPAKPLLNSVSPATICPGDSFRLATPDTGYSYQWWEENTMGMQIIPGAVDSFIYLHNQNNYQLQVTDVNGCISFSDLFLLTVDNWPAYVNASGPLSFCIGGQLQLTAPFGSNYLWSTGDTVPNVLVNSSGSYYFSMLSDYGCPKSSDTVTVTVNILPTISLGPDSLTCDTSQVLLDAGPGFNYYLWQDGSVDQTFLAFSPSMAPDSGDYFVFVTDTNGCTNSDTVRIYFDICDEIKEFTTGNVIVYPNPVLAGRSVQVIRETDGNGYQFLLYNESGNLVLNRVLNPGRMDLLQTQGLATGIYFYRIQGEKAVFGRGIIVLQ